MSVNKIVLAIIFSLVSYVSQFFFSHSLPILHPPGDVHDDDGYQGDVSRTNDGRGVEDPDPLQVHLRNHDNPLHLLLTSNDAVDANPQNDSDV